MAFPSPSKRNQKPQECQEQEVSDFSWQLSGRYLFIVNGCDKSWSHFSHSRALLRGRVFSSNSRLKPVSYLLLSWKELCQYFCIYEKPECFTRDSSAANTMPCWSDTVLAFTCASSWKWHDVRASRKTTICASCHSGRRMPAENASMLPALSSISHHKPWAWEKPATKVKIRAHSQPSQQDPSLSHCPAASSAHKE